MISPGQFCDSSCADQMHIAERELSAFIRAVTQLYGSGEARLAAEDWLDELQLMRSLPSSTSGDWRVLTIAASAKLANRLNVLQNESDTTLMRAFDGSSQPRFAARRAG